MAETTTAPAKPKDPRADDPNFLFAALAKRLQTVGPQVQQRVIAHIREKSGHSTLPSYNANGATVQEKVETYSECISAILKNDFSALKGQVPGGQAKAEAPKPVEKPRSIMEKVQVIHVTGPPPKAKVKTGSFKVGCKTRGDSDWSYNAMRFATEDEAKSYGSDLHGRWTALEKYEVHPSDEPVTAQWGKSGLVHLDKIEEPPVAHVSPEIAQHFGLDRFPPSLVKIDMPDSPRQVFDSPDSKLAAAVEVLRGLIQPTSAPASGIDKAALTILVSEMVEVAVQKQMKAFYADMQSELDKRTINAKYELLRVMEKAYDKHRCQLADAIARA